MPQEVVDEGLRFRFVYEVKDWLIISPEQDRFAFVLFVLQRMGHVDGAQLFVVYGGKCVCRGPMMLVHARAGYNCVLYVA